MASPIVWPSGLLGTAQDGTTQTGADYLAIAPQFVDFATGNDTNAGTNPELPVKTIAQAHTNITAGGVICIFATHNEPVSSALNCNKVGVCFRGYGTGTARSTFTPASGATAVFSVSAIDVRFDNIYFKAATATSGAGGRIAVTTASDAEIRNCQFDCGASDQEAVIITTSDHVRVENCTFTATASRPTRAINVAANNSDIKVVNCTIDGATFGWAGNALTGPTNGTRFIVEGLTLAGKSDLAGTTITTYQMFRVSTSGASSVVIT